MKVHILSTDLKTSSETSNFIALWEDKNDSIEQLTSGSTGTPKKIKINKDLMRSSARMTGDFFNLTKGQSALLCISPEYIGGKMMIVRSIEFELELYATNISSTPLKDLNQPIDFAAMVPLQVSQTLKHHPEKLNLIRNLIIGGAPVSKKLEIALQSVTCRAYSTYGMTETISHIALKKLNNQNEPFIAIGKTSFSLNNDCLVINAPDLNINSLETTDVVELINTREFHWIGRNDYVINSGGIKIHPEVVEEKLNTLFPKEEFIISGEADKTLGTRVIMIAEDQLKPLIDKEKIKSKVERYENPKSIYFVKELSRGASGKINRKATLDLLDEH